MNEWDENWRGNPEGCMGMAVVIAFVGAILLLLGAGYLAWQLIASFGHAG